MSRPRRRHSKEAHVSTNQSPFRGIDTQAVHAGETRPKPYGAIATPIVQTSTYSFENTAALVAHMERKEQGLPLLRGEYARYGSPNARAVEGKLAALEGGDAACVFSSGMAATALTLLTFLGAGDHYIMTDDCYRRTRQFGQEIMPRLGITCTLTPINDVQALEEAIRPNTRLILTETPTNPYLRIVDLEQLATLAHRRGLLAIVDATFGTPCNLRPLPMGMDLVIHSATKYLGGHNDLLGGALVGRADLVAQVRELNHIIGATCDPNSLFLLQRGLKTLGLRMARHNENGQRVAAFLEGHPAVRQVWYPGLASHPDHEIAKRTMSGFGGVVSFELDTDAEGTGRFIDALRIPYIGPSLGGVESIIEQPALMSHFTLSEDERRAIGVRDELVRYALGVEDSADLLDDLAQALEQVPVTRRSAAER
jgi:cystathionine gamma-synthase